MAPSTSAGMWVGGELLGNGVAADVVAVEGDVDGAGDDGGARRAPGGQVAGEAAGELDAAIGDAEEEERAVATVASANGSGQPLDRSLHLGGTNGQGRGHVPRL